MLDDDLGLCRAWRLRAWIEWAETQYAAAEAAWRRAAEHARRAGEELEEVEVLGWSASAAAFGPTPVEEAIPACEAIVERVRDNQVAAAMTLRPLALLRAYTGDFPEARRLAAEANAILGQLGRLHSTISHHEAQLELVAGAPAAAAERLEGDLERLEQMGERAMHATTAALLAQARSAQGRYDDAAALTETVARDAAPEDVVTQALWRSVRAGVLARRGATEEAEALAREAVAILAAHRRADRSRRRAARARRDPRAQRAARRGGRRRGRGAGAVQPQGSGGAGGPGPVRRPPLRTPGRWR